MRNVNDPDNWKLPGRSDLLDVVNRTFSKNRVLGVRLTPFQ